MKMKVIYTLQVAVLSILMLFAFELNADSNGELRNDCVLT